MKKTKKRHRNTNNKRYTTLKYTNKKRRLKSTTSGGGLMDTIKKTYKRRGMTPMARAEDVASSAQLKSRQAEQKVEALRQSDPDYKTHRLKLDVVLRLQNMLLTCKDEDEMARQFRQLIVILPMLARLGRAAPTADEVGVLLEQLVPGVIRSDEESDAMGLKPISVEDYDLDDNKRPIHGYPVVVVAERQAGKRGRPERGGEGFAWHHARIIGRAGGDGHSGGYSVQYTDGEIQHNVPRRRIRIPLPLVTWLQLAERAKQEDHPTIAAVTSPAPPVKYTRGHRISIPPSASSPTPVAVGSPAGVHAARLAELDESKEDSPTIAAVPPPATAGMNWSSTLGQYVKPGIDPTTGRPQVKYTAAWKSNWNPKSASSPTPVAVGSPAGVHAARLAELDESKEDSPTIAAVPPPATAVKYARGQDVQYVKPGEPTRRAKIVSVDYDGSTTHPFYTIEFSDNGVERQTTSKMLRPRA